MKKLSFLMLLCCSLWAAVSMAQNDQKPRYTSFEEGRIYSQWIDNRYKYTPDTSPIYITYVDSVGGDTIVDNKLYKKVWSWTNHCKVYPDKFADEPDIVKKVRCLVRETDGKIYYRKIHNNFEQLIFDYAWVPGDTMVYEHLGAASGRPDAHPGDTTFCVGMISKVSDIYDVLHGFKNLDGARCYQIDGWPYKKDEIASAEGPLYFRENIALFVEGLAYFGGCYNWNIFEDFTIGWDGGPCTPTGWNYIRAGDGTVYYDAGHGLYHPQEPIRTAIGEVEASPIPKPNGPIYDLNGRRLSTVPEKGLYIRNGQLKVAR